MIEKRLAQWYAHSSGVALDIAEREIALTYVLRILADTEVLNKLAFKGGTAIRKLHLGNQGRFSLDLDFTSVDSTDSDERILEIVDIFNARTFYGLTFKISEGDFYANEESSGAEVTYEHDWVKDGRFAVQISFRASPLLPVKPVRLLPEQYFEWLEFSPPEPPSLDLHEIIGEKIRAAAQRGRVRDLFDLYQFSTVPFNRDLVRRIAVIKCWETRFSLKPQAFLEGIREGNYDWADLGRLIRRNQDLSPERIIQGVLDGYTFLTKLTDDELALSEDPYQRRQGVYEDLKKRL